jgi:hypothetical protein
MLCLINIAYCTLAVRVPVGRCRWITAFRVLKLNPTALFSLWWLSFLFYLSYGLMHAPWYYETHTVNVNLNIVRVVLFFSF